MNLREETIKVLREAIDAIDSAEASGHALIRQSEHRRAHDHIRDFLSRLEAGSGEETPKSEPSVGLEGSEDKPATDAPLQGRTQPRLSGPTEEPCPVVSAPTPAPGENSERAEAKAPVRPEHAFAMVDGLLDASDRYNETGSISSLSVRDTLRKELIGFIEDQFAAGRRSMREEAAKVAEDAADARSNPAVTDYGQGACDCARQIEAAIRAIPEKQS